MKKSKEAILDIESINHKFLRELFSTFQDYDKNIPIILHNFPDPDAIASGLGMSIILKLFNLKCAGIYYSGEVSHPQNKSLVTLLNIMMTNFEKEPFEKGLHAICIDLNDVGESSNQPQIKKDYVKIKAIIDHHKSKSVKGATSDVRAVGSTSSIIYEYLNKLDYNFDTEEGAALATALLVGIKTDTQDLMSDNTSKLDLDAYEGLRKFVDKQKLISIINYPLPEYYFELRQVAHSPENKTFDHSTIVSGLGIISAAKRDSLPVIADEFLRMSSVQTSVVFAIIDNYIDIVVRSNEITLDVNDFIQNIFHTGGGKKGSGRATIPLGFFEIDSDDIELKDEIWKITRKIVTKKIMHNVKGE